MKYLKIAVIAAAALLLWSCVLVPGKFDAALSVRRDGSFTYRYTGEMVLLTSHATGDTAGDESAADLFDPDAQVCVETVPDDVALMGPPKGTCTEGQIAEKRSEWETLKEAREASRRQDAEAAKTMLGGLDPDDPATMEEFARRIEGHEGWKRVRHKGKGVFDVHYEIAGRLDRDFVYPAFPEVDFVIPFIHVSKLAGNRVRVTAPAFVQRGSGLPPIMGGASSPLSPVKAEGSFTLTTDARIVTNNTREGPAGPAAAQVLTWKVGALDKEKPQALLQL